MGSMVIWCKKSVVVAFTVCCLSVVALQAQTNTPLAGSDSIKITPDSVTAVTPSLHPSTTNPTDANYKLAFTQLPAQAWKWVTDLKPSTKALICAVIPSGGQLYNQQYWKVPVVWSLAVGCAYAISRYGSLYNEYRTAYRDFMSDNPLQHDAWKPFVPAGANPEDYVKNDNIRSRLKQGTTMYRRNRDLSIILSSVVYLLTWLDAYVDAELVDYDISPNLSMWQPSFQGKVCPSAGMYPTIGVQCSIPF